MGAIITFINEKGGIGKTSCCFNMAWELANQKKKILMLDLDGQRANLSFFAGVEDKDSRDTICEVLKGKQEISNIVVNIKKNLDIVPANNDVTTINQTAKVTVLKKALAKIRGEYDFIFIDVGPSPNWNQYMAASCSDYLLIPMLADVTSLEANIGIAETVEEVQGTSNQNLNVLGIIINQFDGRSNLSKEARDQAEKMSASLKTHVFDTKIRKRVALSENVATHIGITDYEPSSDASDDIKKLVKEFLGEVKKRG